MNAGHEQRLEIAADWLLRLREPAITPDEIAEWIAWCDADPRNRQAFVRQQALWRQAGMLTEHPVDAEALGADTYAAQVPVRDWVASRRTTSVAAPRNFRSRRAALAAGIAVLALGTWFASGVFRDSQVHESTISAVDVGNRDVTLPDGTTVTVAAGASLTTRYSSESRHVFLLGGKAFFRVERDPGRPFVVHALDTKVTAVGTAFVVRADAGVVEVSVTEGSVNVGRPQPVPGASGGHDVAGVANVRVEAGYQITLTEDEPAPVFASINALDVERAVTGTLQFTDEPLPAVVAAVNRYSPVKVVLAENLPGSLRYTGTVVVTRIDEWLEGLPDIFPVHIRRDSRSGAVAIDSAAK